MNKVDAHFDNSLALHNQNLRKMICLLKKNPNPGIESRSPVLQADSLLSEPPGKLLVYFIHHLIPAELSSRISSMWILGTKPHFLSSG